MHCVRKVTESLTWVGADDRRLACFEGVYGVPDGVSYNSYVLTDDKTVLFDTVDKAVAGTFYENVEYALGGRKLDYIVVSHMEPDHAATLEETARRYPEAKIVCNAKIKQMIAQFFSYDFSDRLQTVAEGETLNIGSHNLTFVMTPMVHWPEVMMTYESTEKIFFSADAFGTFGALNGRLFADETDFFVENIGEARRYYTNIVGKYGMQVSAALKKAAGLDIAYVCPLHGFVWRKHFGDFLEKYKLWATYTPEEKGVLIAYASVYGHTENACNILASELTQRGIKVRMFDTSVTPSSYVISEAFKLSHIVFASTTYNAGIFVTMEDLINDFVAHNVIGRKVAVIENGSWAPSSGKQIREKLSKLKNTDFIGENVTIVSSLNDKGLENIVALAKAIAADVKPAVETVEKPVEKVETKASEIDDKAFFKFTYGVQILTSKLNGKDYGCVINTAEQVSSGETKKVAVSVIKKNNTADIIKQAGKFNVSILTEDTPFELLQRFGFQSGRDVDKFDGFDAVATADNGIKYVTGATNAMLSVEVTDVVDASASVMFIGNVTQAKVLSDGKSCTYAYYHEHIKPKKDAPTQRKAGYVCSLCGYFVECEGELPDDYTCPLCNHGKEAFERVAEEKPVEKKGYTCSVCGYFVECEGELPDDYVCPLCNHGKDAFVK